MKRFLKHFGFIVLIAIIGLGLVACDPNDDNNKDKGPVANMQWTAIPAGTENNTTTTFGTTVITNIAYGNGRWVAVGMSGKMAYSDDGISWIAIPQGVFGSGINTITISGIAYGNNRWVAVGRVGTMAYSDDGISWTAIPQGKNDGTTTTFASGNIALTYIDINDISFGNGRWVAVGNNGRMTYSDDGIIWTAIPSGTLNNTTSTFGTSTISGIAYGNNKWIAVGDGNRIAYSDNGISWIALPQENNPYDGGHGSGIIISSIAYGNGKWIGLWPNGYIAYSDNGLTWTAILAGNENDTTTTFSTSTSIFGLTYGGDKWIIVGSNGRMAYSDNGITWKAVTRVNDNNTIVTSSIGNLSHIYGISYGNGRWVAVGNSGRMAYSD